MRLITPLILPLALACGDTKIEQGIAGSAGEDGTSGEDDGPDASEVDDDWEGEEDEELMRE